MPSAITRARVTSCCSPVIRISAASRTPFNVGSDWVGFCAITIKRRRNRTPPKVQSWNSGSARCAWEIGEVAEAALPRVAPTLRSGDLHRPVKYRFPPFEYFGHTGLLGSIRVELDRRRPLVSQPFQLFSRFGYYQLRLLGSAHSIFLPRLLTPHETPLGTFSPSTPAATEEALQYRPEGP